MSRAAAIQGKLDRALARFNVTDRVVSKRITTRTGGDSLLGRGATATVVDTALSPPPTVVVAAKNYPLVIAGAALSPDAEYLLTVSATAMSRSEVANPNMTITFTDEAGGVEELFVIGFSPSYLNGVDIAFTLILSSKQRPS